MYKEKMRLLKEQMRTEKDLKLTGRQLFEARKGIIEDIKLDEDDDEEFKDDEGGVPDEEDDEGQEGVAFYDKALYEADLEEDVEFD